MHYAFDVLPHCKINETQKWFSQMMMHSNGSLKKTRQRKKKHASVNRDRETELAKILLDVIYPPRENVAKRRRSESVLTKQCYEKKKRTYYHTSESFETHKHTD